LIINSFEHFLSISLEMIEIDTTNMMLYMVNIYSLFNMFRISSFV